MRPVCVTAALVAIALRAGAAEAGKGIDFSRDVRPILSDNCFQCHGPDEKTRMAGLRLDTREGLLAGPAKEGEAAVVSPGNPAASKLYLRLSHSNRNLRMPPAASGRTVTDRQVETVRQWIIEGARWNTHWSFTPPRRPAVPVTKQKTWPRNTLDHFVLARLEREGLRPSPEADRATLLRRLSFDLTGLPPGEGELEAFLADKAEGAYESAVERLLKSPHYGEKMALAWLDLARYADTHGYHIDSHRDMWPWRDWVIGSFNSNQRFDRFVIEQIAGDLLPGATPEQRLATGFHRNHMINFEGGAIADEYHTEYVVDRVETTANVFLGLTAGCARCHDHKYDPISQRDFYRLFAFFHNVDEEGLDGRRGNAQPILYVAPEDQVRSIRRLEEELKSRREQLDSKELDPLQADWEKTIEPSTDLQNRLKQGLAAHYDFEGNLADSSGGYQAGRAVAGEPSYPGGASGRAAGLNVEDRVEFPAKLLSDAGRPFTIAFHIRPTHERTVRLFEKIDKGTGIEIWTGGSRYVPYFKRGAPLHLRFGGAYLLTRQALLFGAWSHVALLYDGSRRAAGFQLIVNGRAQDFETVEEGTVSLAPGAPLTIHNYQGLIDDLRIYTRRLGGAEIELLAERLPVARASEIERARRSREDRERLRAYFLLHGASEPWRERSAGVKAMEARLEFFTNHVPSSMVMEELKEPRDTFILGRGDYRNKTDKVTPGVPSALSPLPRGAPANRLGLAQWLVDPSNPLTARVTVNRFWQNLFGTGLVKTSEDFGSQGDAPSHPELLDWLAVEFTRSGWDVKGLVRLMVTSATYRQSSRVTAGMAERDPENRLLARMSRFRLPAETVRDNALAVSGLLNREIGGRPVFPYQPAGLWDEMAFGREFTAQRYTQSSGRDLYRRSMYTFWKRTVPPASLATFDAPDREKCTSRRPITNTPLQALVLMNDPTYIEAARRLAERALRDGGPAVDERIRFLWRLVLSRSPGKEEIAVLSETQSSQASAYAARPESAARLLALSGKADSGLDPVELASWTNAAAVVLSLDETITKE